MAEDEDAEMLDVSHSSYPDPVGVASTPHPYPAQSDGTRIPQPSTPTEEIIYDPTPPSKLKSASSLTSLSDYFKLGNKALSNLQSLARSSGEARRWDDPVQNGVATNSQSPSSSQSTSQRDSASGDFSLPGIHYLPDLNRLNNAIRRNQQPLAMEPAVPLEQISPPPAGESTRGRGRGRPRGSRGSRGWKAALKGTEHADLFKTPRLTKASMGVRGGRGRGRSKRVIDPGHEYRTAQSQALAAYLDNDLEVAKKHTLAAITANPEVWASYALLQEITQKQGFEDQSIQVLASGAPVKKDPDLWVEVAARLLAFKGAERTEVDLEFALKCYDEALKLDKDQQAARIARMEVLRELGAWNRARKECGILLATQPENLDMLWQYAKLCDKVGNVDDLRGAMDEYEKAFRLYSHKESFGNPDEQWDHLNLYLEMCIRTGPSSRGVYQLKQLARWFLGRQEDTFWNGFEQDDREFDETPERRLQVPPVQSGRVSQDSARYGLGLPIDIRVKLGVLRLQMGHSYHTEAFRHFEHLRRMTDPEDIQEVVDLFLEVANVLRTRGLYGAAVDYYDRLKPIAFIHNREYWMNFAQCCREAGRTGEAEQYFRKVIDASPTETQARINLMKLYESTSQSLKALPLANELMKLGRSEELRDEKLAIYIQACKRVKQKAAREAKAAKKGVSDDESSPEEDTDSESDEEEMMSALRLSNEDAPTTATQVSITNNQRPTITRPPLRPLAARPSSTDPPDVHVEQEPAADDQSEGESQESDQESAPDEQCASPVPDDRSENGLEQGPKVREISFKRGAGYMKSLSKQRARIGLHHEKITELWPLVEDDEAALQQWIEHAAAMAKDFRLMKEFYPTKTRDKPFTGLRTGVNTSEARTIANEAEAAMKRLLQDANLDADGSAVSSTNDFTFHSITFGEWHRIFSNLALFYAEGVQQEECYDVLRRVLLPANVFRDDPDLMQATLAVCLCCASMFNDNDFVYNVLKLLDGPNELVVAEQLSIAFGRIGPSTATLYGRNKRRWLSMSVDQFDYLSMPPDQRKDYEWKKNLPNLEEKAKEVDGTGFDLDAGLLVGYASSLINAMPRKYDTALPYLFRALALDPDSLVVNLMIATTHVMRAYKRPHVVRQYDVVQGQAYFSRYYNLRIASEKASHRQEAEFNSARMWHLQNMIHLAVPKYEKVLELSEEVRKESDSGEDYSQEAAFALQGLYMAAGNEAAARAVTEAWLVL